MVHAQTFDLMQRKQHSGEEKFVLFFEWQCEAIDYGTQNLEQLCNAVEALGLVCELEEHVIDRASDVRPQVQEFAINPMKSCLEEISFTWVFRIKQLKKLGESAR